MKASTLFLGFTLVVLAAALAGLWQAFGPHSAPHPKAAASSSVPAAAKRPAPAPPLVTQPEPNPPDEGVRSVYPGAGPSASRSPQPETSPPAPVTPPPEPAAPATPIPATPPALDRSAALDPNDASRTAAPADAVGDGVDLNTASAEALNTLGAGKIAKTIITNRPYTAPDDLVTRRVLKRKDYDAIKARIVVR